MGKTSFALGVTENVSYRLKIPFVIFPPVMSSVYIKERLVCRIAGIESCRFRQGLLCDTERRDIEDAGRIILELPVFTDGTEQCAENGAFFIVLLL